MKLQKMKGEQQMAIIGIMAIFSATWSIFWFWFCEIKEF